MATIYGAIRGITWLREAPNGGAGGLALVSFTMPAYTASSDSGKLGAGGYVNGVANTASLATIMQNDRRDGKTVTIFDACMAETGAQSSTDFYVNTFAVSSGSLTFNVCDSSGSEVDAASGVSTRPIVIAVNYVLS